MICRNGFDVGTWSVLTSGLRPNHYGVVDIKAGDISNLYGMHCANGINGSVSITINGDAHYFGPAPGSLTPSNVSGNIITYNISDFGTIDPDSDFTFVLLVDSTATNGSQICFNVNVNPVSGDNYTNNNILSQCFTVLASYDPNYKEVYPYGKMDPSIHWLTYTVHFQNTGGAPAENIYILDTLDINLDVSTFEVLSTSHQSYVQILEGGIARFNFSNINLIDSTSDEPQSHGYVQYKIKLKDNLVSGTQVKNTASIYFDFNSPVKTNTTINTIDFTSGINIIKDEHSFDVWPVPVHDELIIQYLSNSKVDFTLYNVFGQALTKGKVQNELIKIKMEGWTNGIYFVKVGDSVKCIVKE